MNEQENLTQQTIEETKNDNQVYLDTIKDLKQNTVSKQRYDKLVAERDQLIATLVNGEQITAVTPPAEKKSLEQIMTEQKQYAKKKDACNYLKSCLEFRERAFEEYGVDCFVANNYNVKPTEQAYIDAQKTADIYQECLDYANGDKKVLVNELQRRMLENPLSVMVNTKNYNNNRRF